MKKIKRLKRARKIRYKIQKLGIDRLTIHRTPRHIYAQIISADDSKVLASASTVQKKLRSKLESSGNIAAAIAVGTEIAEKAKAAGIDNVAFDRSGFKYHGRVKALAVAAREGGLKF